MVICAFRSADRKPSVLCFFKTIIVILFLTACLAIIVINSVFNMSYHPSLWGIPGAFSPMKLYASDSVPIKRKSNTTVKASRTLVSRRERNKAAAAAMNMSNKNGKERLWILWYNKPVWINLAQGNNILKKNCLYENCEMTIDKQNFKNNAAIVFALTSPIDSKPPIPSNERRSDQVWIFFGLESPVHTSRLGFRHYSWQNTMNWSMSYRTDADIFFPYGSLEPRVNARVAEVNYSAIFHQKTKHAAWIVSNCGAPSDRDTYVKEMQMTDLKIDIFGSCTENVFRDREELKREIEPHYKFYLSFENSLCVDYITEKFFRYFEWDVVLVVRGGADYDRLLPNDTFIDASKFPSAKALAEHLVEVANSEENYTSYLRNKSKYKVNHYNFMTSYCDICEKLNNLDENRQMYPDHVGYINKNMCWSPTDVSFHITWGIVCVSICFLCAILCCALFIFRTRKKT